jgi:hypothetical protein
MLYFAQPAFGVSRARDKAFKLSVTFHAFISFFVSAVARAQKWAKGWG